MSARQFVLLGERLSHSWSVPIHEAFFRLSGMDASYRLWEMPKDALPAAAKALLTDYAGANVTIPYKVDILPYLDEITSDAQAVGAVNTIENRNGELIGHNTDVGGFRAMLLYHGFTVKGRRCAILGAGGASLAAKAALLSMDAQDAAVFSRTPDAKKGTLPYSALSSYNGGLLINCTPVGMHPGPAASPISDDLLSRFDEAADMIYNPYETLLTQKMKALHKNAATGLYMLVKQAALAEEIWLKRPIPDSDVQTVYQLILKEFRP